MFSLEQITHQYEARPFSVLYPMPHKLRSLQSSWQEQTLFLALSVSSTLPSNLFELFFPWTQGVSLSLCAVLSSLVLCLENFTCLGLSRVSSIPSTPGIWWDPHGFALPALHPGKSLNAVSWGNHRLISFVSHFSGITALFYLISSILITTV